MSNFFCDKCGKVIMEGPNGHYVTGCEHYPLTIRRKGDKIMKELFNFYAAGVQFHELKTCISEVSEGDSLKLAAEPENEYDPNAVAIFFNSEEQGDVMVGYVPAKLSAEVAATLELEPIAAHVAVLNRAEKPWKQLKVAITTVEA